jgi:hypothetical protein
VGAIARQAQCVFDDWRTLVAVADDAVVMRWDWMKKD